MKNLMKAMGSFGLSSLLWTPLVLAQAVAPPPPPPPPPGISAGVVARDVLVDRAGARFHFIAAEPAFLGKPIAGAPYSAEAANQTTRVLADGTRIESSTTTRMFRDSAGRTRMEVQMPSPVGAVGPARTQVTISDPVQRKTIILDGATQTARVVTLPPMPPLPPLPDGAGSQDIRWVTQSTEAGNTRTNVVINRRVVTSTADGAPPSPPAPPAPPAPPVPHVMMLPSAGMTSLQAQYVNRPDNVQVERLGERQMEGVRAEGTRRTLTIPAGAIGNDRPIVSVTEEWRSPELQVVLLRTIRDPQIGDITYKLTNLSRSEPLATLFEVPDGYRVIDHSTVVTEDIRGPE